jgi:hypothetical protein
VGTARHQEEPNPTATPEAARAFLVRQGLSHERLAYVLQFMDEFDPRRTIALAAAARTAGTSMLKSHKRAARLVGDLLQELRKEHGRFRFAAVFSSLEIELQLAQQVFSGPPHRASRRGPPLNPRHSFLKHLRQLGAIFGWRFSTREAICIAVLVNFEAKCPTVRMFKQTLQRWEKTAAKVETPGEAYRKRRLEDIGIRALQEEFRRKGSPPEEVDQVGRDSECRRIALEHYEFLLPPLVRKRFKV